MEESTPDRDVVLPFDCFSSWIHCICVVTFDLELGQAMELIYPKNASLTQTEKMNICYLSFPDSNAGCMGDTQYHFRVRLSSKSLAHHKMRQISQQKSLSLFHRDSPAYLKAQPGYAFGYVYFRQVKDPSIRRGYFQKSVVIISQWPFIRLFNHINAIVAPEFFAIGPEILEATCHDIDQWPPPRITPSIAWRQTQSTASPWLQLPILGRVIQCQLSPVPSSTPAPILPSPSRVKKSQVPAVSTTTTTNTPNSNFLPNFFKAVSSKSNVPAEAAAAADSTATGSEEDDDDDEDEADSAIEKELDFHDPSLLKNSSDTTHVLGSVFEVNYFTSLYAVLPHIQVLWELMITCQPILIIGANPKQSCEMVQALTQLVLPMQYSCDYRPYFTIHDVDFKKYSTRVQSPPSVVLGVTNPFFIKALSHWPHIVRLSDDTTEFIPLCDNSNESNRLHKSDQRKNSKLTAGSLVATLASAGRSNNNLDDRRPGLYTRHKAYLSTDKTLFKKIKKGIQRSRHADLQSVIIRQFTTELTHSFMIPLERYVGGLMPLQKSISPFRKAPTMGRFQLEEFIATLAQSGPQLTCGLKGDWEGLYRRFVTTPLFAHWLADRQSEVNEKLQSLQITSLCELNMADWCVNKQEIQLVDVLMIINGLLASWKRGETQISVEQKSKLLEHVETILYALPADLQSVLRHSNSIACSTPPPSPVAS